ncbi:MAG: phage head closure protein [Acidovorax sp.]|nr:phage head closure protein [Acidovorax sp.]
MTLRAGQLRDRVVIQQKTSGTDPWGAPLPEAWADYDSVWANIRFLSGTESIKAGADVSVVSASIRIRWRQDVTAGMRVVAGAAVYDIEAVLPGARREYVDLQAKRVS